MLFRSVSQSRYPGHNRNPQFTTTLTHNLNILHYFTPQKTILNNNKLTTRTNLSQPTTSHFTYTLVHLNYLQPEPKTNKYVLNPTVLSLNYPILTNIALRQTARPTITKLTTHVEDTISLNMREHLNIMYMKTNRAKNMLSQQFSDIGMAHPNQKQTNTSSTRPYSPSTILS